MGATPLVIIGAGGFGREVLDVVEAINLDGSPHSSSQQFEFLGFLDDGEPDLELLERRSASLIGPCAVAAEFPVETQYVIGITSPVVRRLIDNVMTSYGLHPAVLVHPSATVGADVSLGPGMVVCSHVSMTTHIRFGRHVHLNLNCTVGHDVVMDNYVTVNPGATISGNVHLHDEVSIGTGAAVIQGVSIAAETTVGAGAAVVRDLPRAVVAVGVPARLISRD